MEKEVIPVLAISKRNDEVNVSMSPDIDKYELVGIVETWLNAYKKEISKDWKR